MKHEKSTKTEDDHFNTRERRQRATSVPHESGSILVNDHTTTRATRNTRATSSIQRNVVENHIDNHNTSDADNEITPRLRNRDIHSGHTSTATKSYGFNGVSSESTHRRSTRLQKVSPEEDHYKGDHTFVRQTRRREHQGAQSTKHQALDQQDDSRDHDEFRRSSRQRKLIHHSFNEAELTGMAVYRKRRERDVGDHQQNEDIDDMDMYTRVKRARRNVKKDMYGFPIAEEENHTEEDATTENEEEDEEEGGPMDEDDENRKAQYNLRQHKPRTQLYEATIEKKRLKKYFKETPTKRRFRDRTDSIHYKSPAHRRHSKRRVATHRSSSTSSSGSESEDERRFARRKSKSMAKSRMRCLPMNLAQTDLTMAAKDRQKIGASLADIDPMSVDKTVTFDNVGGLANHIQALKEMIVFPLLYPEVFERFKIAPPRGVLFYGPPGTGKTLVARALANECSTGEKKVAFFMRKGADCLSKWVGESERQLRLLFDQAYQMRPSIIFFDEIDGLAPVRSSRQDQIHSSIVSTLLALMDGLDSRGEVVVIGATNRIDSIDPALRRPGRFDREFLFSLPSAEARADILRIHTKEWNPRLLDTFISEVASKCNGYCGADMKALCTEAALHALRRRYPQIYTSNDKLQLDVTSIDIAASDFHYAMSKIVPAGQRAAVVPGRPLSPVIKPLLSRQLDTVLKLLECSFPFINSSQKNGTMIDNLLDIVDQPSVQSCVTECPKKRKSKQGVDISASGPFLNFNVSAHNTPIVSRPRLLLYGNPAQGHTTHIAPALIHQMEKFPTHLLDLPTLFANSSRTPEESCAQVFREARRSTPSVIYIPHINTWWSVLSDTMKATFLLMMSDLDPLIPILLLATCDSCDGKLPTELSPLFSMQFEDFQVKEPNDAEIRSFFEDLLLSQTCIPPATRKQAAKNLLEVLPKAPAAKPVKLTDTEEKALWDQEEAVLRELRLFLRDMLNKLARDRKFNTFSKPVDEEEVPDYYEIIKKPMDLSTMMSKIDLHHYQTCSEFLDDIDLICSNALEYNPADSSTGRAIRHRACALKDMAHALMDNELDEEFEKRCKDILESRKNRGRSPTKTAPQYYHTKPVTSGLVTSGYPMRYSRRLRQEDAPDVPLVLPTSTRKSHNSSMEAKSDTQSPAAEGGTGENRSPAKRRKRKNRWSHGVVVRTKKKEQHDEEELDDDSEGDEEVNTSHMSNGQKEDEESMSSNKQQSSTEEVVHAKRNLSGEFGVSTVNGIEESEMPDSEESKPGDKVVENLSMPREEEMPSAELEAQLTKAVDSKTVDKQVEETIAGPTTAPSAETENKDNIDETKRETSASPAIHETVHEIEPVQTHTIRLTRSMTNDAHTMQCMEILSELQPTFSINHSMLPVLLDKAVEVGKSCSVNDLEKLYSLLAQKIYQHRASYDRASMLQELDAVLDNFKC